MIIFFVIGSCFRFCSFFEMCIGDVLRKYLHSIPPPTVSSLSFSPGGGFLAFSFLVFPPSSFLLVPRFGS